MDQNLSVAGFVENEQISSWSMVKSVGMGGLEERMCLRAGGRTSVLGILDLPYIARYLGVVLSAIIRVVSLAD